MEEFCPVCMKQGLKKKMKAIQINLEEAVWMCESQKCTWPMEYKELEYIPRKIGESWSCYWHNYKPKRSTGTEAQSDWQSFFTPPYTPQTEVSPSASSDISTHSSNSVNPLYNVYCKESLGSCSSKKIITSNSKTDHTLDTEENNRILLENSISDLQPIFNDDEPVNVKSAADSSQFTLDKVETSSLESTKLDTEATVNTQKHVGRIKFTASSKSIDSSVPTIIRIEKADLGGIRGVNNNQKLPQNESVLKNQSEKAYEKIISKRSLTKQISNENSSSVEVRTVEIEGLPSVTLRYEVPTFLQETNSLEIRNCGKVKSESELVVSKKTEIEKCIQPFLKKSIMTSKMYEKFSFSKLRKAKSLQKNCVDNDNVSNNSEKKSKVKISSIHQIPPNTIKPVIDILHHKESSELTNPTNIDRNVPLDSGSSKDIINDLDSFLNDFIDENKVNMNENMSLSVLQNVDDDWLSSLLA